MLTSTYFTHGKGNALLSEADLSLLKSTPHNYIATAVGIPFGNYDDDIKIDGDIITLPKDMEIPYYYGIKGTQDLKTGNYVGGRGTITYN